MKKFLIVLLILTFPALASAYQVSMTAEASKAQVTKGETFTYKLSIIEEGQADQPANLVPPDFTGFSVTGTFSSTSVKVIQNKARTVTEQEYRLSSDLPGDHVIPPAKIILKDVKTGKEQEITSNPVKVTVLEKSPGLLKGIQEDIRDIKAPKSFIDKVRLFFYFMAMIVVLVLLFLVGLAVYMVRRRKADKRPRATAPIISAPLSAREEALEALRLAESYKPDPKAFYSAVVEAVRVYLKKRYDIPATEATTTEIMAEARKSSLPASAQDKLWALLGEADLVKFAKHEPTEEEKTRFIEKARGLVKEI